MVTSYCWVQFWMESERGWGFRPDGISIHFSREAVDEYIRDYHDKCPDKVPAIYSRPEGQPVYMQINKDFATEQVLSHVLSGKCFRVWNQHPDWLSNVR